MKRALAILLLSTTAWGVCSSTVKKSDYQVIGTFPLSFGATIFAVGDLVPITVWCFDGIGNNCTGTPVVTLGAQTAVQAGAWTNLANNDTGIGYLYYVLSAAASGSVTIGVTNTGPSTQAQVAYGDFNPSAGCTYGFDLAAGGITDAGTGTTANKPTFTPSAGDLVFIFTWVSEHVTNVNAPWACINFTGSGQTGDCSYDGTRNAHGWILSASGSSISNNMTNIHNTDDWQARAAAFTLTSGGGAVTNPGHAVIF